MNDILYVVLPFVISLVLTPLVKRIAYRLDAFAQVNERTVHSGKIVRIGGVAIYVAFIVSMAVFVRDGHGDERDPAGVYDRLHRRADR